MRKYTLMILAAGLLIAAAPSKKDAVKKEWAKLEGTWILTKAEANGKSLLKKGERPPKLFIKDGKISAEGAPMDVAGDIPLAQLDPARKPKWITLPNFKGGEASKGVTAIGIYEIRKDSLRVCAQAVETPLLEERAKERPKKFDSKQGLLLVFKREVK